MTAPSGNRLPPPGAAPCTTAIVVLAACLTSLAAAGRRSTRRPPQNDPGAAPSKTPLRPLLPLGPLGSALGLTRQPSCRLACALFLTQVSASICTKGQSQLPLPVATAGARGWMASTSTASHSLVTAMLAVRSQRHQHSAQARAEPAAQSTAVTGTTRLVSPGGQRGRSLLAWCGGSQ